MTITTIVTQLEPGGTPAQLDGRLASALAIAQAFRSHLIALVFSADGEAEDKGEAAAHALDAAQRHGVTTEVRARSSFAYGVGEVFADQLRVSDLAVLSLHPGGGPATRFMLSAAVFDSGRPVLLVPEGRPMAGLPRRILVGWDASPAAVRAVVGAMPLIEKAEEVIVVTVSDDKTLRTGQSGIELTRLLARHGAKASFTTIRRDGRNPLAALEEHATQQEAEMLVLGAVRHAPLHELIFGSATAALFASAARRPALVAS